MTTFNIFIFSVLLTCISFTMNQNEALDDNDTISKMIQYDKFKFKNKLSFDSLEYTNDTTTYRPKDLIELQDTLIKKEWFGMHDYFDYRRIYYYSIQNKIGQIRPLTFVELGDDYDAIKLLLIDFKTGKLIKSIEIYGGDETGPLDNRYNKSRFINDSTFILKQIHNKCDSAYIGADLTIDAITYKYIIDNRLGFVINKLDSIRIKDKLK